MKKKYIILSIVSVILVSLGFTYAYFTTGIQGNTATIDPETADLKIIFTDSASVSVSDMEPGETITKTFTIENTTSQLFKYSLSFGDLLNNFTTTGNLLYQITSTNSGYNNSEWTDLPKSSTASDYLIGSLIEIPAGVTQSYTLTIKLFNDGTNQVDDMDKDFSFKIKVQNNTMTLYEKLLADNPDNSNVRTSFSSVINTDNTGIMYVENGNFTEDLDNDGVGENVYYFAGNAQKNWVYFGGYYWRIIRTNEDKSVRLLYAGTSTDTTSAYVGSTSWHNSSAGGYNSAPWVAGWMYVLNDTDSTTRGRSLTKSDLTDSGAKVVADNWYSTYIYGKTDSNSVSYDSYVSKTAIYCSDRSGGEYDTTSSTILATGAIIRIYNYNRPSYKCGVSNTGELFEDTQSLADKFSVSDTYGNGLLTYPVALMTADEINYAGGNWGGTTTAWFHRNANDGNIAGTSPWWLMTARSFRHSNTRVYMFVIQTNASNSKMWDSRVDYPWTVRPVISIKACANWLSGDGSATNPYQVNLTSTCAVAEN